MNDDTTLALFRAHEKECGKRWDRLEGRLAHIDDQLIAIKQRQNRFIIGIAVLFGFGMGFAAESGRLLAFVASII